MQFYQTKKFRQLAAQWQRKLERSGFTDIEASHKGTVQADLGERIYFREGVWELTRAYYDWALAQLRTGRFQTPRDRFGRFKRPSHRLVWRLHANGLSAAKIGERIGVSPRWAARLVEKIEGYLKGGGVK